jgi:hypothetical protein
MMAYGLALFFALALLADEAPFASWQKCVDEQAVKLEPSAERADLVADAAIAICLPNRQAETRTDLGPNGSSLQKQMLDLEQSLLRQKALASVVQQRAERHKRK